MTQEVPDLVQEVPDLVTQEDTIPREIHYIWVGGVMQESDPGLVFPSYQEGIKEMITTMDGETAFDINIWFSKDELSYDQESFDTNVRWAQRLGITVRDIDTEITLSDTEEKLAIRREAQNLTEKANFGAISDILHIAILDQFGGIYLDTDNTLRLRLTEDKLKPKYGFIACTRNTNSPSSSAAADPKSRSFFSCFSCCKASDDDFHIQFGSRKFGERINNSFMGSVLGGQQFIQCYEKFVEGQYLELFNKHSGDEDKIVQ